MKVYTLEEYIPYEGSTLYGVYRKFPSKETVLKDAGRRLSDEQYAKFTKTNCIADYSDLIVEEWDI